MSKQLGGEVRPWAGWDGSMSIIACFTTTLIVLVGKILPERKHICSGPPWRHRQEAQLDLPAICKGLGCATGSARFCRHNLRLISGANSPIQLDNMPNPT